MRRLTLPTFAATIALTRALALLVLPAAGQDDPPGGDGPGVIQPTEDVRIPAPRWT